MKYVQKRSLSLSISPVLKNIHTTLKMGNIMLMPTYTIVAAPASNSVGCISHLLQGLGTQVAQLPQTAVVKHPCADPAGVQVFGRPHLAHVTHLITRWLQ